MSCEPPPSAPASVSNSFASQLLSDFIPQNPVLALQMHLPATAALIQGSTRPLFQTSWLVAPEREELEDEYFDAGSLHASSIGQPEPVPPAIADAAPTWIRSALGYRGTGLEALKGSGTAHRAIRELGARDPARWGRLGEAEGCDRPRTPARGERISLAAWIAVKM